MKLTELKAIADGQPNGDPLPGYGLAEQRKAAAQYAHHVQNHFPALVEALGKIKAMADSRSRVNMPDGLSLSAFCGIALAAAQEVDA